MRGVVKAAKQANGRSRTCAICPLHRDKATCSPEVQRVCSDAFVEGFMKGVKWLEEQLRQNKDEKDSL
jgi:hypothetical protein|nr:MAG TPA: hypothetical protein [Caudoviricetes sp.]